MKNEDGTLTLHLKKKSGEKVVLEGLDQVLMATGRKPNTGKLNLDRVSSHSHPVGLCNRCRLTSRCHTLEAQTRSKVKRPALEEELVFWTRHLQLWVEAAG